MSINARLFCQQATLLHICFLVPNQGFTQANTAAPSIDCLLREALPSYFVAPHHMLKVPTDVAQVGRKYLEPLRMANPTTKLPLRRVFEVAALQSKGSLLAGFDVRS